MSRVFSRLPPRFTGYEILEPESASLGDVAVLRIVSEDGEQHYLVNAHVCDELALAFKQLADTLHKKSARPAAAPRPGERKILRH